MVKYCFTFGMVDGVPKLLKAPGEYEDHRIFLRDLADSGGVITVKTKKGRKTVSSQAKVSQATLYHSEKGKMKRHRYKHSE